jgi:hypothetical protein
VSAFSDYAETIAEWIAAKRDGRGQPVERRFGIVAVKRGRGFLELPAMLDQVGIAVSLQSVLETEPARGCGLTLQLT